MRDILHIGQNLNVNVTYGWFKKWKCRCSEGITYNVPTIFQFSHGSQNSNFNIDHVWPNFDQLLQILTTHISQSECLIFFYTLQTPIYHHILPIQRLDFEFKSRTLWTCVIVPTHQEILIGHILTIQLFDWAQSSSKKKYFITLFQSNGQILNLIIT